MSTEKKPLFEAEVCSRCGGSGNYSFNLMHGSTCYGCAGSGWKLTKRGAAARKFFQELLTVPVESLQPGSLVYDDFSRKFRTLESVEVKDYPDGLKVKRSYPLPDLVVYKTYKLNCKNGYQLPAYDKIRTAWTAEEKAAKLAEALAYQDSLTKQGTPKKR